MIRNDPSRAIISEPGRYCGWPANHGAWQRGDEWLVGFAEAKYDEDPGKFHRLEGTLVKKQARSLDAGKTWTIETPNVDFEGMYAAPERLGFTENTILRFCGRYDHGGEMSHHCGAVYASHDFGRTWDDPVMISESVDPFMQCTTRTCVVGDLVFLSYADARIWGSDFIIAARITQGVIRFLSRLDPIATRCVMPSAVRLDDLIYVASRRRMDNRNWVSLHTFNPKTLAWESLGIIDNTGEKNGNPPALAAVGDTLVCAYGVRSKKNPRLQLSVSTDNGSTWQPHTDWLCPNTDMGYPRIFLRGGKDISIVYYRDEVDRASLRIIDVTI